jgi:hypothetical protein
MITMVGKEGQHAQAEPCQCSAWLVIAVENMHARLVSRMQASLQDAALMSTAAARAAHPTHVLWKLPCPHACPAALSAAVHSLLASPACLPACLPARTFNPKLTRPMRLPALPSFFYSSTLAVATT